LVSPVHRAHSDADAASCERRSQAVEGWDNRRVAQANVELARRGFEALFRGDLDVVGGLLDPDLNRHG